MTTTQRHGRRKPNDRGAITVETAVALTAFTLFMALALGALTAAIDKVRCVDAAREAARLTAGGQPDLARDAAARIAPEHAAISIDTEGEQIHVNVHSTPADGLLPGIHLRADAFAIREPGTPDG